MIKSKVVSFEMNSQDPEKAAVFYSNVFGWTIGEPKWGYSEAITNGGGINGGIAHGPSDYPHGVRLHLEVDSIDVALKEAVQNGAQIVREKMEFEEFYLAYLVDPVGVGIGLIENK
ncbi:VOC family protein [Falsibacillus pallidus]|uniref:VOC family protein n=1 Tax=Falsibacillus pallidus TaxID=493781 RepID=UPI003D98F9F5